jgi:CRISPR system Cascade subunit CasA
VSTDQNTTSESRGHQPAFDLTSEPWLPVQLLDGGEDQVSLCGLFARAGEVRRLAGDLATQDFALLRLLLAICHDALQGPEDAATWSQLWRSADPFVSVADYLEEHRGRFDLLNSAAPFYQTPGLHTAKNEVAGLDRIVADVPNGEPFFTTRFPGVERIGFAEAARWLVHAHAYDISGIKSGVVGDERAKGGRTYPLGVGFAGGLGGVLAEGSNLRETLLLNLVADGFLGWEEDEEDLPAWRRPVSRPGPGRAPESAPSGPRDLYTWQGRRILLHADAEAVHGVVLTYGDPLTWYNKFKLEPMTGWRHSPAQEKKLSLSQVYMPHEHSPARAAWRGLSALIARGESQSQRPEGPARFLQPGVVRWIAHLCNQGRLPKDKLIRLQTYGMVYGTQQSVIDEVVEDHVEMRLVLLDEARKDLGVAAVDAVSEANDAVRALGGLAFDLAIASVFNDKRRVQGEEKTSAEIARDSASERGYAVLDGLFRSWLSDLDGNSAADAVHEQWQLRTRREIGRLAGDLINSAPEAAWNGRVIEESNGTKTWRNAASAERRFWFNLRRALPLAFPRATGAAAAPGDREVPDETQEGTDE